MKSFDGIDGREYEVKRSYFSSIFNSVSFWRKSKSILAKNRGELNIDGTHVGWARNRDGIRCNLIWFSWTIEKDQFKMPYREKYKIDRRFLGRQFRAYKFIKLFSLPRCAHWLDEAMASAMIRIQFIIFEMPYLTCKCIQDPWLLDSDSNAIKKHLGSITKKVNQRYSFQW